MLLLLLLLLWLSLSLLLVLLLLLETFFAPLDSSGREIRNYTRLLGITNEMHKAARYHEWDNIPHGNGGSGQR